MCLHADKKYNDFRGIKNGFSHEDVFNFKQKDFK